jgi:hypothetical protein
VDDSGRTRTAKDTYVTTWRRDAADEWTVVLDIGMRRNPACGA